MDTSMRWLRGVLLVALFAGTTGCPGTRLSGEGEDDSSSDALGDAVDDGGAPDEASLVDGDAILDDGHRREDGSTTDDAGDGRVEDGAADDADVPAEVVGLEPEGTETYVVPVGGETVRPHRHAVPAALGPGIYALVLDVGRSAAGLPLTVALYRFDPRALELRQAWLDEASMTTDYNSVCWTGEAFVAALPTSRVGLRVLAVGSDGTPLRDPVVLEPDAAYSTAGAGQPPVVLCPADGPFVIDHGRGAGGTDRLYALTPDGTYDGTFVDADLPSFSTTTYYASTPCTVVDAEVACATPTGLVFVRRDGSYRVSDAVAAPGMCPSGTGCDVARTADGLAAAWSAVATDHLALMFARFAVAGSLDVPTVAGPDLQAMLNAGIRAASSGATVLVSAPSSDTDPLGPIDVYLFDTAGAPIGTPLAVGACSGMPDPGDPGCPFPMGGSSTTPLFWEGDAYAAVWVPEGPWSVGQLAYRRFRLVGP